MSNIMRPVVLKTNNGSKLGGIVVDTDSNDTPTAIRWFDRNDPTADNINNDTNNSLPVFDSNATSFANLTTGQYMYAN